ncbi:MULTISPECIES: RNA polymerase sigma factor [unclassified Streptomyces]|uniref:RNA polymerase sigma factor n=1 Tax=unclassified Streptomyces TaxID=2593676 RepID=UPI000F9E462E|nr:MULTISPECIES: sigma-70 family RNA polymerase sigma factor [unclassified Streptomyces]RPK46490.1 ECF RNA polymerase sigma factor SigE [Streptomyces sp. ADI93-02]
MPRKANAELLAGCARGEQESWDTMVERFGRLVWSVVRSHRMSDVDAEDVRQLTWLRLVQNVERIRDPERVGDWLATVARRESLKVLSRRKRLVMVGDSETLDGLSGHSESPEQITLRAQRREDAQRAIDTLSEQCRGVLMLALADPPASYDEISTALAMSVGSVGPIRTRCLRRLRRALAAADAGERIPAVLGHARCPLASAHADVSGPRHRKALVGGGPEAAAGQAGQAGQE